MSQIPLVVAEEEAVVVRFQLDLKRETRLQGRRFLAQRWHSDLMEEQQVHEEFDPWTFQRV